MPLKPTARFELDGVEIFAAHGHKYAVKQGLSLLENEEKKQGAQLVCFGDTHRAEVKESDGITYVNPGSFTGYYSPTGSTYAVVTLEGGNIVSAEIKKTES